LVVGGGGAACRAAIEADERGAQVLLVVKGVLGECGSTAYRISDSGGYAAATGEGDLRDNPETYLSDILHAGRGLCDPKLAKIQAMEAPKRLYDLERWGVRFQKPRARPPRTSALATYSRGYRILADPPGWAYPIVHVLRDEIKRRSIEVMENTMITSLLTKDEGCVGAIAVDDGGNFIVIKAKSTILGSGGAGQVFLVNHNPPDVTGDGYAMAYRAGAELMNMEFFQIGYRTVYPVKLLVNPWVFGLSLEITNGAGESFLEKYLPKGVDVKKCLELRGRYHPFSAEIDESMYIDIAVYEEIRAGKGTEHMGVYFDVTKAFEEEYSESSGRACQFFFSNGIDMRKKPLEVSIGHHAVNGGLRINEKAAATLPGLYAVGEVAAGPHGADRIGGHMLAACQVFGARAGEHAAARALVSEEPTLDVIQVASEYNRVSTIMNRKSGIRSSEAKRRIQETMWRNVMLSRTEEGLKDCLNVLHRVSKKDLPSIYIEKWEDLFEALAIRNLLDVGQIVATTALLRRESRGSHHRKDFPKKDDGNWLKNIVVRQEQGLIKTYTMKF
jgi:succinate dehydrogenase/fumarate reductase flavoprotein subunit